MAARASGSDAAEHAFDFVKNYMCAAAAERAHTFVRMHAVAPRSSAPAEDRA
jgi:hypothetical protein